MPTAARLPEPRPRARLSVPAAPSPAFLLTEQLLEARRCSRLPTNLAGPDEDVNIYLALRLEAFARAGVDPRVVPGLDPLVPGPPPGRSRRERADWYRANADHRLLNLGLFGRGDTARRRDVPWGLSREEAFGRDLAIAKACYALAADLLERGPGGGTAAVAVLRKLAARGDDYVHVLAVLAVRRLGLGAQLDERDLAELLAPRRTPAAAAVADLLASVPADAADVVLDLWLDYRRAGDPALRRRGERLARAAGLAWPQDGEPTGSRRT